MDPNVQPGPESQARREQQDMPDRAEEKRVDVPQNEEPLPAQPVTEEVTTQTTETTQVETIPNLGGGDEPPTSHEPVDYAEAQGDYPRDAGTTEDSSDQESDDS